VTDSDGTAACGPDIRAGEPLAEVTGLSVAFGNRHAPVPALREISMRIGRGEAIGVVGESGSGKTTLLRSIAALVPRPFIRSGAVRFGNRDLLTLRERELATIRGREIGMVFQDPVNCFNPAFTIGYQLRRAFRLHRQGPGGGTNAEIGRALDRVGVDAGRLARYPFEFSQGQLQRLMIAAACFAGRPALLLADEPTTSLDVTTEAQILGMLRELRRDLGMALVLVTHNLALAAQLCDRVLVMYAGRIVEEARVADLFARPAHPYTRQLLRSLPVLPRRRGRLYSMPGDPASAANARRGCPFAPRCEALLGAVCADTEPGLLPTGVNGQLAACHRYDIAQAATENLAGQAPA
jgi:oligopeptide/dipeptide ABC transporter ATP-binding protein